MTLAWFCNEVLKLLGIAALVVIEARVMGVI